MTFDINQLDSFDDDFDEEKVLTEYRDALMDLFLASAEGQALADANPDIQIGFWSDQLMYYGYVYEGYTIPQMTDEDVEEIVVELFPRKISLSSPDDADYAIPELMAFWQFLKRAYALPNASEILRFLRKIEPGFKSMMMNPANFGMAKSFMMAGQAAGFDMSNTADIDRFMVEYNMAQMAGSFGDLPLPDLDHLLDLPYVEPATAERAPSHAKKKQKRKMAKASRKKNRKNRK